MIKGYFNGAKLKVNASNLKRKIDYINEAVKNLPPEEQPKVPRFDDIEPIDAAEVLVKIKNEESITNAVSKGEKLNLRISEYNRLKHSHKAELDQLPEEIRIKVVQGYLINEEALEKLKNNIEIAKAYNLYNTKKAHIFDGAVICEPLNIFYKAFGVNPYKLAAQQFESPNLIMTTTMASFTRGTVSMGLTIGGIIGTAVSAYHKGGAQVIVKDAMIYSHKLSHEEKIIALKLSCLKDCGCISEKDYVKHYYGLLFNESNCFITNNLLAKFDEPFDKMGLAEKVSIISIIYYIENNLTLNKLEIKSFVNDQESKLDSLFKNKLQELESDFLVETE